MCGRFVSQLSPEALQQIFHTVNPLPNVAANWNVAPSQKVLVIRRHPQNGQRHLDALTWGLVPHFIKDLKSALKPINARAETAATSAMFRGALAQRRCLVPASAFYEWRAMGDGKQPFAIARADAQTMAFAGLWEGWRGPDGQVVRSFVILTCAANSSMRTLHERMPVIIERGDWATWLGDLEPENAAGNYLALLRACANDVLKFWPVARTVNSVANNGEELLREIDQIKELGARLA